MPRDDEDREREAEATRAEVRPASKVKPAATRAANKARKAAAEAPKFPRVYESFVDHSWQFANTLDHPSAVNGDVRIRRYRITVELVDEPVEVLRARLLELWRTSERNHHTWHPMWNAAIALGVEAPREFLKIDEQARDHVEGRR